MPVLKILGSLTFALTLIALLAVILTVSTILESVHGTPFVQKFFYQAGWFDVLLGLLAVNIVCSTLTRLPFKKRHTGFVITHVGILALLVGSLLSRLFGLDAHMMLFESESKRHATESRYQLFVHSPDNQGAFYDLALNAKSSARKLAVLGGRGDLRLHRAWEDAVSDKKMTEGPAEAPSNRAAKLTLSSELTGFKDSLWLLEHDPENPDSHRLSLGPATVELKEKKAPAPQPPVAVTVPTLRIEKNGGQALVIDLTRIPQGELTLPDSGLRILNVRYYPDARVQDNRLVSISESPDNPAVEFDAYDTAGRHKHTVQFALFPEFDSLHGREAAEGFDLKTDFLVPELPERSVRTPSLFIYYGPGGWSYESKSSKSFVEGELTAGRTYSTGWMDFSFRVDALLDRAVVSKTVRRASQEEKGEIAAEISLTENGRQVVRDWVMEGRPVKIPLGSGNVIISLAQKQTPVPFVLTLKDFRKEDYPGTTRAASYESDVSLHDTEEHITLEKTIRMNEPLDYKGYRIFQSSFIQDPEHGEASVFTVAKNPGIFLIYSGSIVLFLGVFITFFIPSFSSFKN